MVDADPMVIAELPDESASRARLRRSGRLLDGELDLAIDLDGALIGRPLLPGEPGAGLTAEMPGRELAAAHEEREILG